MFFFATAFNQNLCEWLENPKFPNNIYTGSMFKYSGCDVTDNPSNHVCKLCPSLSPLYSNSPTHSPITFVAKGWTLSSFLSNCEGDCNYNSECDAKDYTVCKEVISVQYKDVFDTHAIVTLSCMLDIQTLLH